jgi:hypothetical protein
VYRELRSQDRRIAYLIVATTMVKVDWDLFRGYGCLFGETDPRPEFK